MRIVDVYFEGRLVASCPLGAGLPHGSREEVVRLAKEMVKDDGVMSDEQLARASFRVRMD